MDNEFLLTDRLQKIRQVIGKFGEENFYLSYSGGKDSTVLSALLDMAVPGNTIPRVYSNTGIEYQLILDFVERERERDHPWEIVILKPRVPIKQMLEKEGYPFKSKFHARAVWEYQQGRNTKYMRDYMNQSAKWKDRCCPNVLLYQFTPEGLSFNVSDRCCDYLKKNPLKEYEKETGRRIGIIGIMPDEGGRRTKAVCQVFKKDKLKHFQPLVPVTKEWEDWFIEEYNVDISDIYKEPYCFQRTGCKGCPFALEVQNELDTLKRYFPKEYKQCEAIWQPVYEEYRRLGYRLRKDDGQMYLDDFFDLTGN